VKATNARVVGAQLAITVLGYWAKGWTGAVIVFGIMFVGGLIDYALSTVMTNWALDRARKRYAEQEGA